MAVLGIPEFVNPEVVTSEQWNQIRMTLVWLWAFTGAIVVFGGCLLMSQALIPSLASTRDIPERYLSFRPALTGVAIVFLLIAIFALVNFVINLQVLYEIYPRVWI